MGEGEEGKPGGDDLVLAMLRSIHSKLEARKAACLTADSPSKLTQLDSPKLAIMERRRQAQAGTKLKLPLALHSKRSPDAASSLQKTNTMHVSQGPSLCLQPRNKSGRKRERKGTPRASQHGRRGSLQFAVCGGCKRQE